MPTPLYIQIENSIKRHVTSDQKDDAFCAFVLQDALSMFVRYAVQQNLQTARYYYDAFLRQDYGKLDDLLRVFLRQMICIHEESKVYMRNAFDSEGPIDVAEHELDQCNDLFRSFLPPELPREEIERLVVETIGRLHAKETYDKEMVYYAIKGFYPGSVNFLVAKQIIVQHLGMKDDEGFLIRQKEV